MVRGCSERNNQIRFRLRERIGELSEVSLRLSVGAPFDDDSLSLDVTKLAKAVAQALPYAHNLALRYQHGDPRSVRGRIRRSRSRQQRRAERGTGCENAHYPRLAFHRTISSVPT
jgi:hypothetical protein